MDKTTIQNLIILRCLSQFDIEAEPKKDVQNETILNIDKRTKKDKQREAVLPEYAPDPISDNEDSDHIDPDEVTQAQSKTSDHKESLPTAGLSQIRPRRAPKRRRDDDVYEYGT